MAASVWRGSITFGLVSIPVRLVKAARRERTRFRRVQRVPRRETMDDVEPDALEVDIEPEPEPAKPTRALVTMQAPAPVPSEEVVRVRNAPVNALTDEPLQRAEILKGYEVGENEFVVLKPEEVAALRPRTSSQLEITDFVRLEEIDPLYYETSYYVVPEEAGAMAYNLLFATLKQTGHAGMGALAMHGREHVVLIRAGQEALVLHSMFYANEVGRPEYRVGGEVSKPKELQLAKMLVGALEARFEPEKWKDRYEERLNALIQSRMPEPSARAPESCGARPPVADIMEALRKSLELARKPVASQGAPAKGQRRLRRS